MIDWEQWWLCRCLTHLSRGQVCHRVELALRSASRQVDLVGLPLLRPSTLVLMFSVRSAVEIVVLEVGSDGKGV